VLAAACASPDVRNETVGQVNGEAIKAGELREFLGYRGGAVAASDVPVERKKEALDRLVAGRLLAQEARARGLDNTEEFRRAVTEGERDVLVAALFSRELAKITVSGKEAEEEAARLRQVDKNLPEKEAAARGRRAVFDRKARRVEEELVAAAKKALGPVVDQAAVERIVKGEAVGDETVLATAGTDRITYGAVKAVLAGAQAGPHGGKDLFRNPVAIGRVIDREVTGRALAAYARKEGVAGSEWMAALRKDYERATLINLLAEKVIFQGVSVSDAEVRAAYDEHGQMFIREGKKIPFKDVEGQIRAFLENRKRRAAIEAYVDGLKKKAKITVNEGLLPKV